jgi:spore coat protein U-like protein
MSNASQLPQNLEFTVNCNGLQWTGLNFTSQNPLNGNVIIGGQTVSFQGGSDNNDTLSFQLSYDNITYSVSGIFKKPKPNTVTYNIDSGTITKPMGRGAVDVGTWSATAQKPS